MLEHIIENFRNDSQFINDFDGIEVYLNGLNISFEEKNKVLREVFEYNCKIYSIICEDNNRLKKIISARQSSNIKKTIPQFKEDKETEVKKVATLKLDVSFYIQSIKNCKDLSELESILPDKKSENYLSIVHTILLKLYEEIFDIKKMLYQERNSDDLETKEFFNNEMEIIKFKINVIKNFIKPETKNIENVKNSNELVFLKTNYGNVCAFSDLKDISLEYYDQFYELLESICDGSFKNFKTFTNNDLLKGLSEVRGDQTRIIFDRINNNTYVIIYMFIKKTDKNASYYAALQNRNELYKLSYNEIKKLLENSDEYLKENRDIKDKVYRILTKENKIKKLGEIHG